MDRDTVLEKCRDWGDCGPQCATRGCNKDAGRKRTGEWLCNKHYMATFIVDMLDGDLSDGERKALARLLSAYDPDDFVFDLGVD